jgi:glycerol-3-phosphate cytidylyltransferase
MEEKKMIIGYTSGVFDLFHIGHLNILKEAHSFCDYLIVGVTTDELTKKIKNKLPLIPYKERIEIVRSCKYTDKAVKKNKIKILEAWQKYQFDIMIKGDDWKGTPKGEALKKELKKIGVQLVYFPYTNCISSTKLTKALSYISRQEDLNK